MIYKFQYLLFNVVMYYCEMYFSFRNPPKEMLITDFSRNQCWFIEYFDILNIPVPMNLTVQYEIIQKVRNGFLSTGNLSFSLKSFFMIWK